jgi:hypothetical protein
MRSFAALLLVLALRLQAGTVTDSHLGYSINLPAGWVQVKTREEQHHFKDPSGLYPSRISIVRSALDKTVYPTPESWTQAQFIAYKLTVETSAFPFGTILYHDSTAGRKLGNDWAPEAFSMLFPGDGQRTYCEYIRFAAHGDFGYEIYALGDSADMMNRVDYYAGIIATVVLSAPAPIRNTLPRHPSARPAMLPFRAVDPLGRTLVAGVPGSARRRAAGIWYPDVTR